VAVNVRWVEFGSGDMFRGEIADDADVLRAVFEGAPDAIVLADRETGEILDANPAAAELTGYRIGELVGSEQARIHPGEGATLRDTFAAHGEGLTTAERHADGSRIRIERADGERLPVEVSARSVEVDGRSLLQAHFRDVSDRVRRQRALERRSTAIDASMDGVALLDAAGEYTYVNPAHAALYGYDDPAELEGCNWRELYDDEEAKRLERVAMAALDREGRWRGEAVGRRADGSTFDQELTLTAFEGGGLVCVVRDVTERAERERALERQNEQLERFASIVSHDLRNPLNVARAAARLARERSEDPAVVERLADAAAAHERMTDLVDDVLTLAREGRTVGEREPVALAAAAERAWDSVAADGTTLETEAEDHEVAADPERLRTLLENLLANSVEHGGDRVRVGPTAEGFHVADDGPGIDPEDRERAFEDGYTTAEAGTGFGLSIVAEIADAHGWSVTVEESREGGARFVVSTDGR
jgi:PAS domain S-box-containing protein